MYGGGSYSELAYLEHTFTPLDAAVDELFRDDRGRRVWTLELKATPKTQVGGSSSAYSDHAYGEVGYVDALGQVVPAEVTLRFATEGYTSGANDVPADVHFQPRLLRPPTLSRQVVGRDGVCGLTEVRGDIRLSNADGGLDGFLRNYVVEGKSARVMAGNIGAAYADFELVSQGSVQSFFAGELEAIVTLSDGRALLKRAINESLYAGTGALEGGSDLAGKNKPAAYGAVWNAPAVLVDSARLIYQVHDGLASDVPAVYDRQVVLARGADYSSIADMNATAPSAGQYRVCLDSTGSYFRLGATPAGTVTCDIKGDASGSGYVATTADIVLRILLNRAQVPSGEIDATSFGKLNGLNGATVGARWAALAPVSCEEIIDELLYGIGAFGGYSRRGFITVGLVAAPAGDAEMDSFTEVDIMRLERLIMPSELDPVLWRVAMGWQPNEHVQDDVAAAVTAARRDFARQAFRYSTHSDATVQSRHPLAKALTVEARFAEEADALFERNRRFTLWGDDRRGMFDVTLRYRALARDIGQVVRLVHRRHGFADPGLPVRVLNHRVEGSNIVLLVLA